MLLTTCIAILTVAYITPHNKENLKQWFVKFQVQHMQMWSAIYDKR